MTSPATGIMSLMYADEADFDTDDVRTLISLVSVSYFAFSFVYSALLNNNKMPTICWGRQNAAPLKFESKPSEAAFSATFKLP